MKSPISATLLPMLEAQFGDLVVTSQAEDSPVAVFAAKHPDVGGIEIYDEGGELTFLLGSFVHTHFACSDETLSSVERAERIASEAVTFLKDVFADNVEFYGGRLGGGCRPRIGKPRSFLSKVLLGSKSFVWSGPVENGG